MEVQQKDHQALASNFSDQTYADVESTFADCSDHVKTLVQHSLEVFRPKRSRSTLLDIGAGPGFAAKALQDKFRAVTVVDPNTDYLPYYKKLSGNPTFRYIIGNFQKIEFPHTYSNILCSHMLYHVPQSQWGSFLLKMQDLMDPKGTGLILLTSPKGRFHELCNKINPNYSHSGVLCQVLNRSKIPFAIEYEKSTYSEPDRQKFSDLVHIFAIDDCYLPQDYQKLSRGRKMDIESMVDGFIDSCFDHDSGLYRLHQHSAMVVIHSACAETPSESSTSNSETESE